MSEIIKQFFVILVGTPVLLMLLYLAFRVASFAIFKSYKQVIPNEGGDNGTKEQKNGAIQ